MSTRKNSDPEICPKAKDGKHISDPNTLTVTYDGNSARVDINCRLCGRSGCLAKLDVEKVAW